MTTGNSTAGYRDGLRQQSVVLTLSSEIKEFDNFDLLDEWLHATFEIDAQAFAKAPPTDGSQQSIVTAWSWRVLELGAAFVRGLGVPAFEPGRVLEVLPPKGGMKKYQSKCLIPYADHVPNQIYTLSYQQACDLSFWMMSAPRVPENVETLFNHLQSDLLNPLGWTASDTNKVVPMLRAAWRKGIPYRNIGAGYYQLGWGASAVRTVGGAIQFDSAFGSTWANHKQMAGLILREAGLPAPVHRVATDEREALVAARTLGWPLVVKPTNRERGEGVSVDVRDEAHLLNAFRAARQLSREVLIERQAPGVCHRIMVANDKVWIVSKRGPKAVRGDGRQTVRQLVDQANDAERAKPPWSRLKPFPLDDLALECLAAAGLTPDSVPDDGQLAPLRKIQSTAEGGVVEDQTKVIHGENVAAALKAARLFGLSMAGVDMISTDIGRPWYETGAIINEVNFNQLLPSDNDLLVEVLGQYMPDNGRIPIEVVVGGEAALADGLRIRDDHAKRGLRAFLTSHDRAIGDDGESVAIAAATLDERCIALLADPRVEALVVVVQNDALLATGLPFDRITAIHRDKTHTAPWVEPVLKLLKPFHAKAGKQKAVKPKAAVD